MRRTLALVSLAVGSMIALALLVPLAFVVWRLADEEATNRAQRQISELSPIVATGDQATIKRAVENATTDGGRICVRIPGAQPIGRPLVPQTTAPRPTKTHGVLLQPVNQGTKGQALIEAFVDNGTLPKGVRTAWLAMAAVAAGLVVCSMLVADRIGARAVGSARRLARAATALGAGDLTLRVDTEGPPELQDAGHAFNAMADRIVQRLAAEREIAADLSHRLRTPLTALRLNVDALGQDTETDQTRLALARLEREVDLLIRAVRPSGDDTGPGSCEVGEVVRERLGFWSVLAEDQARSWRLSAADRPALVPVSRRELATVLDALLGNIFTHTAEGTAFAVSLRAGPDRVGVFVSDAGPGIADPDAALLRGASSAGSTGLGLDIARRLAESTGGRLRVGRSSLGGAEVAVWLRTAATSEDHNLLRLRRRAKRKRRQR
jgi:signal transduction histidine kinase